MIFSALFFGYLVNAIGKFMMENQQLEISIKIKLATINSELKDKNVSKDVSILVLRYLEYALRKDNSESDRKNVEILNSIHPDLKFEILKEIYVKIFKQIKGFEEFSEGVLAKFAQYAEEWSQPPGKIIIDETQPTQEPYLYYIESGSVIIFLKDSDCYLKELGPTQIFGEFGFFTRCNRFSSVMSKDYVTLVRFNRNNLDKCVDSLATERLVKLKYMVNIYSDFSFFDIICYSCRGRNHTAKNCKYTHFEMNKRTLVAMKRAEVDDRKICIRRNRRPFFAVICNKEIKSAIVKLQAEQIRNHSYSVIDTSENDIEVAQNQKNIESKNAKNKRRTHRGRSNAMQSVRKKSTDKVAIGGFGIFYEGFNIEKVCNKYARKDPKAPPLNQAQTVKPLIEVKRATTNNKDFPNVLGTMGTQSPYKQPRKSIYVRPN